MCIRDSSPLPSNTSLSGVSYSPAASLLSGSSSLACIRSRCDRPPRGFAPRSLVPTCSSPLVLPAVVLRDLSRVRLTVRLRNCLGASLLSVVQPQCSRPLLRQDVFLMHPLSVVPAQLHVSHNQFPADPIHDGVVSFLSIAASPPVVSGARVQNCSVRIRSPSSAYYPVPGSSSSFRRYNTPSRFSPLAQRRCAPTPRLEV